MKPAIVEQRANTVVTPEDLGHRFARSFDADGQAKRFVTSSKHDA
jgi:hypothetical protein